MEQVNCLYCGKKIPEDTAECPHCGGISHFQQKGYRSGVRKRFIIYVTLLSIACIFLGFYLPR